VAAFVENLARHRELPSRLRPAGPPADGDPALLRESLERLQLEHEELVVAEEELRVQTDELLAVERAREAAQGRYREVFEAATEALFVADRMAVVEDANPAALRLLSIDPLALRGKPLAALVERADAAAFHGASARAVSGDVEVTLDLAGRAAPAWCCVARRCATARASSGAPPRSPRPRRGGRHAGRCARPRGLRAGRGAAPRAARPRGARPRRAPVRGRGPLARGARTRAARAGEHRRRLGRDPA
jgi:hypothetical protein